jgi:multidrug efflux system membrane fusion protein
MKKLIPILMILLFGCSTSGHEKNGRPPVKVEVADVIVKEIPIFIDAIGNIEERTIVQIKPQVQGILLKAYVTQGQEVEEGELLYEIDSRPFQAAYEEALGTLEKDKAALEQAKITLQRNKELVEKKYIPVLTFEQFETNVKTAEAQLKISKANVEKAKINLDYCKIRSPITGKVSVFNIFPGSLVKTEDTEAITEIRQLDPIDVRFSVPQKEFQWVQAAQQKDELQFEATLSKEKEDSFIGTIYFVDNHVDLNTGTIKLKGVLDNKERKLWPGEFVNVRLFIRTIIAMAIPASAVQAGSQGPYVYVVEPDMTVKAAYIETGDASNSVIVVTKGLKVGDRVVINGQVNLTNGSKIQIIDKGNPK